VPDDPYKYFRVEAQDLLDQLNQDVLALDQTPSPQRISRLLRHAHTLKGAAHVVKQRAIGELAHEIEERLAPFRQGLEPVPSALVNALLEQLDAIVPLLAAIQLRTAASSAQPAAPQLTAADSERTLRANIDELDGVVDGVSVALSELGALRGLVGKLAELRRAADLGARPAGAAHHLDARTTQRALEQARTLCEHTANACRDLEAQLTARLERALRELDAVRVTAEQLRLSPTGVMFDALKRAVRDAAQELGKQVRVETHGGDTRLDGSVFELVQRALFHVVRNAVAHGIETPEQRRALGKPAIGLIRIEVRRRGRGVEFSCQDDGGGIDQTAVRAALIKGGAMRAEVDTLAGAPLHAALLRAGVSTAGRVTSISGRGVGLDVLRDAAERLGGTLHLDSPPGSGLRVELVIPLSIASIEALAVESDGQQSSLPLDAVSRSIRLDPCDVESTARGQSIVRDGEVIPFVSLSRALRRREQRGGRGRTTAVILRSTAGAVALGVDRVLGTKTIVLRKLPALLPRSSLVAGATLDALGQPVLVLDPEALRAEALRSRARSAPNAAPRLPVMIVDDSLTTRMLEQSILESAGYEVVLASSAEQALSQAHSLPCALFLCDVEMPGMDGFSFVEHTLRDPALRHIPCVLVSSHDAPEDIARGRAVGARGYVVKSRFDQRELLTLIGKLLAS
jgi:two-component system chemotaxis sensor kinase CheA